LAAILVMPESGPSPVAHAIAAAFMTIAMMCSGVAPRCSLPLCSSRFVRRGWRIAVATAAVPAAAYALWYVAYGP
jgi:hypothetical protein